MLDPSRDFVHSNEYNDGRPATEAAIKIPGLVDMGVDGNLYIAQYRNHMGRKLLPARFAGESLADRGSSFHPF